MGGVGGVLRSEVCKDGVLTGVKQIPETSPPSTTSKNDAMKHLYKRDIFAQLQYYIFFMYQSKPCPAVFSWFAFGRFWSVADPEGYAAGRCRKCWVCSNTTDIMLVRSRWCPAEYHSFKIMMTSGQSLTNSTSSKRLWSLVGIGHYHELTIWWRRWWWWWW